jgi:hypothetical protein
MELHRRNRQTVDQVLTIMAQIEALQNYYPDQVDGLHQISAAAMPAEGGGQAGNRLWEGTCGNRYRYSCQQLNNSAIRFPYANRATRQSSSSQSTRYPYSLVGDLVVYTKELPISKCRPRPQRPRCKNPRNPLSSGCPPFSKV